MKKLLPVLVVSVTTGISTAEPFEFERAWGSPDLDPSLDNPTMVSLSVERQGPEITSLARVYEGNPDAMGDENHWVANFVPSPPFAISLYEIYRGNPDGGGYETYHERVPDYPDRDRTVRERHQKARGKPSYAKNTR